MSLTTIKAAIKTIAETVSGIENVRNELYNVEDESEIKRMMGSNGRVNALGFISRTGDPEHEEGFELESEDRQFIFILYYEQSIPNDSFDIVDNLSEGLKQAFNRDERLRGTVVTHNKLRQVDNRLATVTTKKKVHIVGFEFVVTEAEREIEVVN